VRNVIALNILIDENGIIDVKNAKFEKVKIVNLRKLTYKKAD
jgi:hypothetical protein